MSETTEIPTRSLEVIRAELRVARKRTFWFDIQGAKLPSLQQADSRVRELEAELAEIKARERK
jgi:hypothetical protein